MKYIIRCKTLVNEFYYAGYCKYSKIYNLSSNKFCAEKFNDPVEAKIVFDILTEEYKAAKVEVVRYE